MPDLADRSKREKELAALLLLVFDEYKDKGVAIDWDAFRADLETVLGSELASTYRTSFEQLQNQMRLDLGSVDLESKANEWANTYSQALAGLIVDNTKKQLEAFSSDGGEEVSPNLFDETRADRIAITETTRSITAGEFAMLGELAVLGLASPDVIWHTADDDMVCDACRALHGVDSSRWSAEAPGGPPLHVHCRCWLDYSSPATEAWTDEAREASIEARRAKKTADGGHVSKRGYMDVGHEGSALLWFYNGSTGRLQIAANHQAGEDDSDSDNPLYATGKWLMHEDVWDDFNSPIGLPEGSFYGRYDPTTGELSAANSSGAQNRIPKYVAAELRSRFPKHTLVATRSTDYPSMESEHQEPTAAVGIVRCRDRWLLGLSRATDDRNNTWCFPGGGIKAGESPKKAAEREVWEETGVLARAAGQMVVDPAKEEVVFVPCVAVDTMLRANNEFSKLGWFSLEDMRELNLHHNVLSLIQRITGSVLEAWTDEAREASIEARRAAAKHQLVDEIPNIDSQFEKLENSLERLEDSGHDNTHDYEVKTFLVRVLADRLTAKPSSERQYSFILDASGGVVGAGTISLDRTKQTATIQSLGSAVKGGGKALVSSLEDKARKAGANTMLLSCSVANEGFYKHLGYTLVKTEAGSKDHPGGWQGLMSKSLIQRVAG